MMSKKKKLISLLKSKNIKIASVESFTGGMFSTKIVDFPGASKFYEGTLVTYSNSVKEKLAIDTSKGVVNEVVAREMALHGKKYFNVDYCISFTGNAGPSTLEGKKKGLIYVAINETVWELKFYLKTRNQIRKSATNFAFFQLLEIVKNLK